MNMTDTRNVHQLPANGPAHLKPPTTKELLLFVVTMRRMIRRAVTVLETQSGVVQRYRRRARVLREYATPFDAAQIEALDAAATSISESCKPLRDTLKTTGRLLIDSARLIDAGTTLAQRCEILNVNVAERAGLTETDGIREILFGQHLEDSAARRKAECNDGPLYQAIQEVFIDFLCNTEEGRKLGESLFEPGSLLASVPMYISSSDGLMVRQPPRLRVVPLPPPADAG